MPKCTVAHKYAYLLTCSTQLLNWKFHLLTWQFHLLTLTCLPPHPYNLAIHLNNSVANKFPRCKLLAAPAYILVETECIADHQLSVGYLENLVAHFLFIAAQPYILAMHHKIIVSLPVKYSSAPDKCCASPRCIRTYRVLPDLPDSVPALPRADHFF